jgi:hypothetical protein
MDLVFIYGPPAAGKLTIARELGQRTGFAVFHNHATVDLLLEIFPFGSPAFVRLREEIWLEVVGEAAATRVGLIFTFNPERTVRLEFVPRLIRRVESADGRIHFVELVCPPAEIERRIENPSRAKFRKLRSIGLYRSLEEAGALTLPGLPPGGLAIDTVRSSPSESADAIVRHFGLMAARPVAAPV